MDAWNSSVNAFVQDGVRLISVITELGDPGLCRCPCTCRLARSYRFQSLATHKAEGCARVRDQGK
jgi:hypothetical protein